MNSIPEDIPVMDEERNIRTCRLIMHCIALYPQTSGSDDIVADEALKAYKAPYTDRIDLHDIARVKPEEYDGLADYVYAIHDRFGVSFHPSVHSIRRIVRARAADTFNVVRREVQKVHERKGTTAPSSISDLLVTSFNLGLDPSPALSLHDYLRNTPDIRRGVVKNIKARANYKRSKTQRRQDNALLNRGYAPVHKRDLNIDKA